MWRIMLAKGLGAVALISGNESRYTAASLTLNFEIIKSKNWKLIWLMYMYHNGPSSQYCYDYFLAENKKILYHLIIKHIHVDVILKSVDLLIQN